VAIWQLQEAKQRFSELVRTTLDDGPQVVTRNGREVVVVVAADEWRADHPVRDFKQFLVDGPPFDDLAEDLERPQEYARDVDLDE
jgi:prevent-host-death family protein